MKVFYEVALQGIAACQVREEFLQIFDKAGIVDRGSAVNYCVIVVKHEAFVLFFHRSLQIHEADFRGEKGAIASL